MLIFVGGGGGGSILDNNDNKFDHFDVFFFEYYNYHNLNQCEFFSFFFVWYNFHRMEIAVCVCVYSISTVKCNSFTNYHLDYYWWMYSIHIEKFFFFVSVCVCVCFNKFQQFFLVLSHFEYNHHILYQNIYRTALKYF